MIVYSCLKTNISLKSLNPDLYTKELSDVTRINVGIHPKELPDKLLLAEHREIKRIPNVIKSGRYSMAGIPAKFTLGKGHVKFFYSRLLFLRNRYVSLYKECIARSFNVQDYSSAWEGVPPELYLDYQSSEDDRQIVVERIESKGFSLITIERAKLTYEDWEISHREILTLKFPQSGFDDFDMFVEREFFQYLNDNKLWSEVFNEDANK